MSKKIKLTVKYVVADIVASVLSWFIFLIVRNGDLVKFSVVNTDFLKNDFFYDGFVFWIPLFWIFIFWFSGYYNEPLHKSRLTEFLQTLLCTFIGSTALFIYFLVDGRLVLGFDYKAFLCLNFVNFSVVYLFRYFITRDITYKVHNRILGFNTIIIGTGKNAKKIQEQLLGMSRSTGHIICGFISVPDEVRVRVDKSMVIGSMGDIDSIMTKYAVEEVIVAIDNKKSRALFSIVKNLFKYDVELRFTPRFYDYIVGGVRLSSIYGEPLVGVLDNRMPFWQQNCKMLGDKIISVLFFLLFWPLLLYLSVRVKCSSPGPVFYKQERLGLHGKPFFIYKFRTMFEDSEPVCPMLTCADDVRVTSVGRVMRKYRLDELPQFFNVLKGDMSLVGPRPERQYYVDKIIEKAPHYSLVHKVKPGITSWGMVKYGYADNVDKMIERLRFDIIYLENVSLRIDMKILIHTILTIVRGSGV